MCHLCPRLPRLFRLNRDRGIRLLGQIRIAPDLPKAANHDLEAAVDPQTVPYPPIVPIAKRNHPSEKTRKNRILEAGAAPGIKPEKEVTPTPGAHPFGKRAGALPAADPQLQTPRGNPPTKRGAEVAPLKKVYDPEGTDPIIRA